MKSYSKRFRVEINQYAAPSWYTSQAVGVWKNIGAAWVTALGPMTLGGNGPNASEPNVGIFSYSGGCVNRDGFYVGSTFVPGSSLICWGGGHNAYGGNEVCAFRLNDQTWYRVRNAFANPIYDTVRNSDGTPSSRHSGNALVYIQSNRRMFSSDAYSLFSTDGDGAFSTDQFDFTVTNPNTNDPWIAGPDLNSPSGFFNDPTFNGVSTYDPVNDRVIHTLGGNYNINQYDVATDTWTKYPSSGPKGSWSYSDRKVGAFIPTKQWAVYWAPDDGSGEPPPQLFALDCSNLSSNQLIAITSTGTVPPAGGLGMLWDETNERLVMGGYGKTLYFCTPPATIGGTWNWTSTTPSGGDTPASNGGRSGEYLAGRFAYVKEIMPGVTSPGYITTGWADRVPSFYKL